MSSNRIKNLNKKPLTFFKYGDERFDYSSQNSCFINNYDKDFQLFIIWEKGRTKEKEILNDLAEKFRIIECFEIQWSSEFVHKNFLRFYGCGEGETSGKVTEVGAGAFLAVIIEDMDPKYLYLQDVSGRLKLVNSKAVLSKRCYRKIIGPNYRVHSSDSVHEFFKNAILLFGVDRVTNLLSFDEWNKNIKLLPSDLQGARGWSSVNELFGVLNLTTSYVVLRNAEATAITAAKVDGDIDVLCENLEDFIAISNARRLGGNINLYHICIDGKNILFDVRFVGDMYFDPRWQKQILDRRVLNVDNIYIPRIDDYFFSHLYHAFLHKPFMYKKYFSRLDMLAKSIGLDNLYNLLANNEVVKVAHIIEGYLLANGFRITIPVDEQADLNIKNVCLVEKKSKVFLYLRLVYARLKVMPSKFLYHLKCTLKKNKVVFNILTRIRNNLRSF